MKNKRLSIAALLLALAGGATFADGVSTNPLVIRQGGTADLEIVLASETALYKTFQLDIDLPEGLSFVRVGETSQPTTTRSERLEAINPSVSGNVLSDTHARLAVYSTTATALAAGDGVLISVRVQAAADATVGTLVGGRVYDIEFSTTDNVATHFDPAAFTTTVTDRVVLDENATDVPEAASGVKLTVRRTIKAGEWNTTCLPFAMTEAQTKEAFGNDVELADFAGCETEFDESDNVVGIAVNFNDVSAIEANHPYIIKVSAPVTEFSLNSADITPSEDDAYIEFDNGKTGTRRVVYSGFYGTYHAQTVVPEYCLFLIGNNFWYSMGQTKMKAFRAYFEFLDVLSEVKNNSAVKMVVHYGDETGLAPLTIYPEGEAPVVYDMQGRRVKSAEKGVYIINKKKVMVR